MELNQYLEMFLEESYEHLTSLSDNLLLLENDHNNKEIVNVIFRSAHTLKGMAGTMSFSIITSLTHKMENLLDSIRSGDVMVTSEIIDILLKSLTVLENQVKSIEQTGAEVEVDISGLELELQEAGTDNLVANTTLTNVSGAAPFELPKETKEYLERVQTELAEQGYKLYKIGVRLDSGCMLKEVRAYLVFTNLEDKGTIVYSDPSVEDIEAGKFEYSFTLLYSSMSTEVDIKDILNSIAEIEYVNVKEIDISNVDIQSNLLSTEDLVDYTSDLVQDTSKVDKEAKAINTPTLNEDSKAVSVAKKSVRVDIDRLDNLMNLVSELIIVKTRLEDSNLKANSLDLGMNESIEYLERITTNLHDAVMKVRMVAVERVFNRFPRVVRDLSRSLDKEIELHMLGQETEVDRTIIDELGDPLIHLLRNSIDHGIESKEKRLEVGKSEVGNIWLRAYPDGNTVVIEAEDDGGGINVEKVKQKAIEKGIITEQDARDMDTNSAAELIFAPGFSTADQISDISGRGVGLDVVKTKIEALGGVIELNTETGKGSKFIIRLPLTLAILQALMVTVSENRFAIPLNNIREITDIRIDKIREIEGKNVVYFRDKTLSLLRLSTVLNLPSISEEEEHVKVVIVRKGEKEVGLIVDTLVGQQEIVVKSLGALLENIKGIAGATILGNGGLALILDTNFYF